MTLIGNRKSDVSPLYAVRHREPQLSTVEVLPEDSVFGLQVLNDVLLAAIHPAGHGLEEKLEVWRGYGGNVGRPRDQR